MTRYYDFPAPAADLSCSGIKGTGTAGEDLVFGNVCYLKADGKFWKADASALATTQGRLVVATRPITAESLGEFLFIGLLRDDSWAWIVGGTVYVSATSGEMTQTPPGTPGEQVRKLGYADTPATVWFDPDSTIRDAGAGVGKTLVYNGLSPLDWEDLDLSGFAGLWANKALVLLAFNSAGDMNALAVRAKGDSSQYYDAAVESSSYGCALGHHDASADMVLLVTTDANGIIQWISETQRTATVYMLAYIK